MQAKLWFFRLQYILSVRRPDFGSMKALVPILAIRPHHRKHPVSEYQN
jgi:hypothetical protein